MENFVFIKKLNFNILNLNPYSQSYLEHSDNGAM